LGRISNAARGIVAGGSGRRGGSAATPPPAEAPLGAELVAAVEEPLAEAAAGDLDVAPRPEDGRSVEEEDIQAVAAARDRCRTELGSQWEVREARPRCPVIQARYREKTSLFGTVANPWQAGAEGGGDRGAVPKPMAGPDHGGGDHQGSCRKRAEPRAEEEAEADHAGREASGAHGDDGGSNGGDSTTFGTSLDKGRRAGAAARERVAATRRYPMADKCRKYACKGNAPTTAAPFAAAASKVSTGTRRTS